LANTKSSNEILDVRRKPSANGILQRFGLNARQWTAFQAALDSPPPLGLRLAKLLREPSVFERRGK